jgi:ligand-binding SRPBCC domain-containing protein
MRLPLTSTNPIAWRSVHIYKLHCEMVVQRSLAEVFCVFENPYNLAKITPPWLSFRVNSKEKVEMKKGAEIDYRIKWLVFPFRWKTIITEYRPPFLFVDEQAKGPYAYWRHRHTFTDTGKGVEIGDRLEYTLPLGVLGRVAHALIVKKQLRGVFEYRQRQLTEMFDGQAVTTVPPEIA